MSQLYYCSHQVIRLVSPRAINKVREIPGQITFPTLESAKHLGGSCFLSALLFPIFSPWFVESDLNRNRSWSCIFFIATCFKHALKWARIETSGNTHKRFCLTTQKKIPNYYLIVGLVRHPKEPTVIITNRLPIHSDILCLESEFKKEPGPEVSFSLLQLVWKTN